MELRKAFDNGQNGQEAEISLSLNRLIIISHLIVVLKVVDANGFLPINYLQNYRKLHANYTSYRHCVTLKKFEWKRCFPPRTTGSSYSYWRSNISGNPTYDQAY